MTPYAALMARTREDAGSVMLTYRHPGTGERMELSAASLANAIAKTAGLLTDDIGIEPGAVIGVHLPLHWQRVVWLGACAASGAIFASGAGPADCDVCVVDRDHLEFAGQAPDDVLVSLAPFGLPDGAAVPPGVIEAAVAMRAHPDSFVPYPPPAESMPLISSAGTEMTQGEVMVLAADELARRSIASGERFAIFADDPMADVLSLGGPLVLRSSAVLIAHPASGDLAGALREEGIPRGAG